MHSTSAAGVQIDRIFGEPWIKPLAEYIGSFKHEWEHRSQTFAVRLGTNPEHAMCDVYLSHPDFYNFYVSLMCVSDTGKAARFRGSSYLARNLICNLIMDPIKVEQMDQSYGVVYVTIPWQLIVELFENCLEDRVCIEVPYEPLLSLVDLFSNENEDESD